MPPTLEAQILTIGLPARSYWLVAHTRDPLFLSLPASLPLARSSLWAGLCVGFGHCIAQCREQRLQVKYLRKEWMRGGNARREHGIEEKNIYSVARSLRSF